MCLAPGLIAFSVVNVLARSFYALGDTKTPMKISICCLTLNLLLSGMLVWRFKQGGLGIANTATSLLNVWLLTHALRRKLKTLELRSLRATWLPLALAGTLGGVVAWFGWRLWEQSLGHDSLALKIGAVFAPAAAAGLVYFVTTLALKVPTAKELCALLCQRPRWPTAG